MKKSVIFVPLKDGTFQIRLPRKIARAIDELLQAQLKDFLDLSTKDCFKHFVVQSAGMEEQDKDALADLTFDETLKEKVADMLTLSNALSQLTITKDDLSRVAKALTSMRTLMACGTNLKRETLLECGAPSADFTYNLLTEIQADAIDALLGGSK